MFAHSISATPTTGTGTPLAPQGVASVGFAEALSQAQALVPGSGIDEADEHSALLELFHLIAMLKLGIVDPTALEAKEAPGGHPAGPSRIEVEHLKELLRRLMTHAVGDPEAGKPGHSGMSLQALLDSLPPDLRALVKHAFPDLDDWLKEEAEGRA